MFWPSRKKFGRSLSLSLRIWRDLGLRILPLSFKEEKYAYAFLVHLRDLKDVYRFYPFLRWVRPSILEWFLLRQWPYVLASMNGLISQKGESLPGYVITIPLTSRLVIEHPHIAKEKIRQAVKLAEKLGIKLIGLGALIASATKGGRDLVSLTDIKITTGHAYTAHNVSDYLFLINEKLGGDKKTVKIGIVGAAGFIGSATAELLAREGFKNFLLIDLESKRERIESLLAHIHRHAPDAQTEISHHISLLKEADYVIAVTSAPEALIRSEHLKRGAVVIDDAIPSDVHDEVLERNDVLVINGGAVHTPNIKTRFDFGLHGEDTNFCCVAEILALSRREYPDNFVIGLPTLEQIDLVTAWGKEMGFNRSVLQDKRGVIGTERITALRDMINSS